MAKKTPTFTQFEGKYDAIANAKEDMLPAMDDLRSVRTDYDFIDANYYNTFSGSMEFDDKSANILKSGMSYSSVEIARRGLRHPVFRVDALNKNGFEAMNAAALSKAVLEWGHRESGYINAFQESKEEWAKGGDGYRRAYVEDLGDGRGWPQYEALDPRDVLVDANCRMVWDKNVSKSASWWAYTNIYDEMQIKRRFGKEIIEYAEPGAFIDVDRCAIMQGKNQKGKKQYYEVIEYQNCADEVELVLIGHNAFPVKIIVDGEMPKVPKKIKHLIEVGDKYVVRDRKKKPELSLHNTFFYYDKRGPRNLGLVKRLAPIQHADERIENLKLEATQLKMFEIPTVAGGREDLVRGAIQDFVEERRENVFAVLHAPSNIEGVIPKFDVMRFNGVNAEEGQLTTDGLYTLARNTVGIDMTRLEVQANITLGQSQLIEQEKLDTLETIILNNQSNLEHEYEALLDFIINNDGFGLDDIKVSCDHYKEDVGVTEDQTISIQGRREMSIVEAARELKGMMLNVTIDDSSLVNRTYVALLDSWIKLLGVVNPEITPDLYKFILKRIGESGRFDVPDNILAGVENQSQATGGASQFQSAEGAGAPSGAGTAPEGSMQPGGDMDAAQMMQSMMGGEQALPAQ